MKCRITSITLLTLFAAAALAEAPAFEIADVRPSAHSTNMDRNMSGPSVHAGRYIIRTATMLDLISSAYSMDPERVYGGPTWLEMDRFDIVAKLPPGSNTESHKKMLQELLAERFHLKIHTDTKPLAAYLLSGGKRSQFKESDGSGEPGCKFEFKGPNGPPPANGGPQPTPQLSYTCRSTSMASFANQASHLPVIQDLLNNRPVIDQTGLEGEWDFNFTFPLPKRYLNQGGPSTDPTVFDVLEKQFGLKLELGKVPQPVMTVEGVDRKPTENSPEAATVLAGYTPPTEFEVAAIKPTDPEFQGINFNIDKSGNVNIRGATLKFLFQQVLNLSDDMVVGLPKWMDTGERWDIIAKPPSSALTIGGGGPNAPPPIDWDTVTVMLKSLLEQRFKLASHMEERPIPAYTLMAAKPKMKAADPTGRTKCFEGPGPDGKDPREANPILGRLITCQNMPMATLADMLQGLASGYIHAPVLDATGLTGAYDFTLSFSTAGQLNRPGEGNKAGDTSASDPSGALSLLDALPKQLGLKLEQQKRPIQVMVIDHIEPKPTDN